MFDLCKWYGEPANRLSQGHYSATVSARCVACSYEVGWNDVEKDKMLDSKEFNCGEKQLLMHVQDLVYMVTVEYDFGNDLCQSPIWRQIQSKLPNML